MASILNTPSSSVSGTHSFSVSAGNNRVLIVGVTTEGTQSGTMTCTYGGQSMTNVVQELAGTGTVQQTVAIFFLNDAGIQAASGTTITPGNVGSVDTTISAASYQDCVQTTPTNTDTDTSAAATPNPLANCDITTTADNSVVVAVSGMGNAGTAAWNAPLTERTEAVDTSSTGSLADDEVASASTVVACECTWTTQNRAAIVAIELVHQPSAGITDVSPSEFDMDEASVTITGQNFGSTQGSGTVYISDADTLAGSANEVEIANGINTWSNTSINLDLTGLNATELSNLHTLGPGTRYIIVVTNASDEYGSSALTLHRPEAFRMSASANIAASGEATTAQLTAPAGKTTGDFVAGRIQDDENPSDAVDITADDYTELEWSIEAKVLARAVTYNFRITVDGTPLDTYSVTPDITITAGITLVVAESAHSHTADNVALTQKFTLVTQESSHSHLADNVDLVQGFTLTVAESSHGHTVPNVDLVQKSILATNESAHSHLVDQPSLIQSNILASNESLHSHTVDNVDLIQANTLVVAESNHSHVVDSPTLSVSITLVVQESNHAHSVDGVDLVQANVLTTEESLHSHSVDNVDLVQKNTLVSNESNHSHTVPNISLIQNYVLAVEETLHSHLADSVVLTQKNTLVSQEALHSHTADNVTLSVGLTLVVSESTHGHSSESPNLVQSNVLSVNESSHSHVSENVTLSIPALLEVQESIHAHNADSPTLLQGYVLVVNESQHSHTVDSPTLSVSLTLEVQDSTHGHTVDAVILSQKNILDSQEAIHTHTTDNVDLIQNYLITVSDTIHSHSVANVSLSLIANKIVTMVGKFNTGDSVTIKVYNLEDNSLVINSAAVEVLGLGYFKYKFDAAIDTTKEYMYIMSNGTIEQAGRIIFRAAEVLGEIATVCYSPAMIEKAVNEIHAIHGLKLGSPAYINNNVRKVENEGIELALTGNPEIETTITRQP